MNPALRVLKNTTALSLAVLLERGVSFFLPWYVARVQGREVWGYYSTALAFVALAAPLAQWGFDRLLPREIARDHAQAGTLLANAGIIGGVVSLLTTGLVVAIVHFLYYPPVVERLIYVGVILTLFPLTESVLCEAVINGLERMEWIVMVRFPATVLRVAGSIFLLSKGFGIEVLFYLLAMFYLVVWGTYFLLFKRFGLTVQRKIHWPLIRALGYQAVPFVLIISVGETFKQIDRVFLSKLWDTDAVGVYAVGIMLVQIVYLIAPAVMNALFPVLSRAFLASRERFSVLVSQFFKYIFITVFPVALLIIIFAKPAILLVFGKEYALSVVVLQISALGIVPSFVGRLLFRTLLASNNERLSVRVALVNSTAKVALNILLIPYLGIIGASLANAGTELVGLSQNLFYVSRRVTHFDFRNALLRPGTCMLVSLPVCVATFSWNPFAAWSISTATFLSALILSRTITKEEFVSLVTVRPGA